MEVLVLHSSLFYAVLKHDNFCHKDISQGSVETCLMCDRVSNNRFNANLLVNLPVK